MNPRVFIFAGPIGSGKTEIAINYALMLHQKGERVALLDFDIVKPYIRVRDNIEVLRNSGLNVLAPEGPMAYADMPTIPPQTYAWIADTSRFLIIDVGGGQQGSTPLAQILARLKPKEYEFILVINPFRPFSKTVESIKRIAGEVAFGAKAHFNSIVGNPHLKEKSSKESFLAGLEVIKQASKEMNLPIKFIAVSDSYTKNVQDSELPGPRLPLQLFVKYPWETKPMVNWIYKK